MRAKREDASLVTSAHILWKIPLRIIAFCQNYIQLLDKTPEMVDNFQLIPWFKFKELIFDIYDHRITNAPEINNSMNSSYCTMNEHIIIYFVDVFKNRPKAEEKII